MPKHEAMIELSIRFSDTVEATSREEALRVLRERFRALRAQDPRLSSIEEVDFEVSEVPERGVYR